jgi:hypothetical protein
VTKLEQVALAMAAANGEEFTAGDYLEMARAAVEALREPSIAMRHACRFEFAEVDWPAMIDAILDEEPRQ